MFSLVSNCNEIISLDHEHQWKTVGILCENRRQTAVKNSNKSSSSSSSLLSSLLLILLLLLLLLLLLFLLLLLLLLSEQRPETLTVDDLKDLRYLECVIKVRVDLAPHTQIPTTLKFNLY